MNSSDRFGTVVTFKYPASFAAWCAAMDAHALFTGDPVALLAATDGDPDFALGLVYRIAAQLRGGATVGPELRELLSRARALMPAVSPSEKLHIEAVQLLADGEITRAGAKWDDVLRVWPNDFLALKLSHDAFFLVGDAASMLASARAEVERLKPDAPARHVALSQFAFALEENGQYTLAERFAREALAIEARDCWALHCLVHVYEMEQRHGEAIAFLESQAPIWRNQNMLDLHIWWHLALRHIEGGKHEQALAVFDEQLSRVQASNVWRLTDATSLLWRLDLVGAATGDRWSAVAQKWTAHARKHQSSFLDVHAAMAFSHTPDLPEAVLFFESLAVGHGGEENEKTTIYRDVAWPLAMALRLYVRDAAAAAKPLLAIMPTLHRIGGSRAQRDVVERTCAAALLAAGEVDACSRFLDERQEERPTSVWILSHQAALAQQMDDDVRAALLADRAADMIGRTA